MHIYIYIYLSTTRACAPMQRCSSFFAMEAIANLCWVLREHRACCRFHPPSCPSPPSLFFPFGANIFWTGDSEDQWPSWWCEASFSKWFNTHQPCVMKIVCRPALPHFGEKLLGSFHTEYSSQDARYHYCLVYASFDHLRACVFFSNSFRILGLIPNTQDATSHHPYRALMIHNMLDTGFKAPKLPNRQKTAPNLPNRQTANQCVLLCFIKSIFGNRSDENNLSESFSGSEFIRIHE